MEMYISPSPGPPPPLLVVPLGVDVRKGGERLVDVVDGEGVDAPRKRNPGYRRSRYLCQMKFGGTIIIP